MPSLRTVLRLVTCCVVAIVTLELCARLDDYVTYGASVFEPYQIEQIYEFDALGRKGKPYARFRKWKLNSLGYRGPELQPDSVRIAVFGASETFGLYESPDHEFPRLLEGQLNEMAGHHRFDVVNVAYAGMPASAMIQRAPEIARRVRPRVGIVYPTPANYIWLPWLRTEQKPPALPHFEFRLKEQLRTTLKNTLPDDLQNWLRSREIERSMASYGKPMDRVPQQNVERFTQDLHILGQRMREHGMTPVFLTHASRFHNPLTTEDEDMLVAWRKFYPMLSERGFIDMEKRMNEAIKTLGAEHGYKVVDVAPEIPAGSKYFADFTHFTDDGSRLFAKVLSKRLFDVIADCCAEDRHSLSASGK